MWKEHEITLRNDESFVITKNGYPYHVLNEGEFTELWAEINSYVQEHPERASPEIIPESIPPTLEEARAAKLREIIAGADAVSATVKAGYSRSEIDSWRQQEAEARALLADAEAPAPLVRDLAADAGVSPSEFARRVLDNAKAAEAAGISIILRQRAMEKAVKAAESVEAVLAVNVSYGRD